MSQVIAATITLNDDTTVEGTILQKTDSTVIIQKENGMKVEVPQNIIVKIEEDEKDAATTYDPKKAAQRSIIPLRSGSFVVDYNWPGITFVVIKAASLIIPLSAVFVSFGVGSNSQNSSDDSSSYDPLEDEKFRNAALISLGVWISATAGDAFYSYRYVQNYNEKVRSAKTSETDSISYHLSPRISRGYGTLHHDQARCDGVDFGVMKRF